MEKLIKIEHINKYFGSFKAIDDMSFELEGGKIYGIIGPNGAGKSTTMSILIGLIFPSSGSGTIKGYPLGSNKAKSLMGYSPEFPNFYSDMSCLEYLVYMAQLSGLEYNIALKKALILLEEFGLSNHKLKKVSDFSTGMKKKVGLIQALIHDPEVLLLDEPTANLDPSSRSEIICSLKKLVRQRKMTVLISSHVLSELETIIDHVILINQGRVILNQPITDLQEEFNQEKLLVACKENKLLNKFLDNKQYQYSFENNIFIIKTKDKISCKRDIVEFIYQNNLELNLFKEETITLEKLYQQVVEGKK